MDKYFLPKKIVKPLQKLKKKKENLKKFVEIYLVLFNPKNYEKNGLTEDEALEIKEAFDLFDTDHSGTIDTDDLKQVLSNLGIDAKNQTLQNMINDIDKNQSGTIDFDEFIEMMTAKMSDKDTPEDLRKVFDLFIGDDTADKIELSILKEWLKNLEKI